MLQTSSPSYIIMSYLDIARELMELEGEEKLDNLMNEITWFTQELQKYPEYRILSNRDLFNKTLHDKWLS
jgi:arginine decarboxylase